MTEPGFNGGIFHFARIVVFGGAAVCLGLAAAGAIGQRSGETVPAVLSAKAIEVTAGRDCRLAEIFVNSGQTVTSGEPLLRFRDDRLEALVAAKQREISEAEVELQRTIAAADVELTWRRRDLEREVYQTELESTRLRQERLSRQVEQIAWQEHLGELNSWAGGDSADLQVQPVTLSTRRPDPQRLQAMLKEDAAAASADALLRQLTLAEARLKELGQLSSELEQKVRVSVGVDVSRARLQRVQSELVTLQDQQAQLTVHSTTHATVGLWRRQPGDHVTAGDVIVELLDDAQLSLTARIPSSTVSNFASGRKVDLLFPGDCWRQGVLGEIPPQVATSASDNEDARLPLQILPSGKLWPKVPSGTRVSILLPQ